MRTDPAWVMSMQPNGDRDLVLVVSETLAFEVQAAIGRSGFATLGCSHEEATAILDTHGLRIAYAVIFSSGDASLELRQLLADRFPEIRRVVLVA